MFINEHDGLKYSYEIYKERGREKGDGEKCYNKEVKKGYCIAYSSVNTEPDPTGVISQPEI
jgi:hypothetical protein